MPRLFCLWSDNYNLRSSLKHIYVLLYSHEVKVYQEWTATLEDVSKTRITSSEGGGGQASSGSGGGGATTGSGAGGSGWGGGGEATGCG